MALLNTWASQQDQATLSPLDRLLNNYIQKGDAPLAYLMRGDAQGLLKDLNTPKPVNMTQDMTNAALNLNPVMGLIGATAYHGSPYLFDKFNINRVGSGEGAQAYGHGMYFAENPKVAEDYAKKLGIEKTSMSQLASDYLKQDVPPSAIRMLHDVATSSTPIEEVARKVQGGSLALRNESPDVLKNIVSDFRNQSVGNVYKVDIPDQDIPKLLNWDAPIKDQPEMYSLIKNSIKDADIRKTFENNAESGITGANAYSNYLSGKTNADKSKSALNIGIKGIKYLDQSSRQTGGTSNFVVFDPSNVKILEKGLLSK
jgi:hypothetical protein